ncbi:MAG: 1-acyl-sn-glycerol-3-phosphate acyltransferase [Gemmatimonadales bacterium]|nr:1-acyl-sn-glycerol-3-phosphate acyltransferase [Gemmatimonadales bacterium]
MIAAPRDILSMFCCTVYHAARIVLAAGRGEEYAPGGIFDEGPRQYARDLVRINRITLRGEGLERVEGMGPCVFVANHQSWLDILALLVLLPGSVRFVAKKELGRVPLFGPAMRAAGHIEVDRRDLRSAVSAYEAAGRVIRSGFSALVFPEGTRSRDGRLLPFKKGPFVLAIVAQVPVVPVVILGSHEALPRGSVRPRPVPITVRLGGLIPTAGLTYADRDTLAGRVRSSMLALGARE